MRPNARPAGFRLSRIGASLVGRAGGLLAAVLVALQPLTAGLAEAQVITDPTAPIAFRPRVGVSPRGAPVVDITAPSLGGLSHNKFREYNVDTRGLILNNSGLGGTSVLGGEIGANPNLVGRRPASVILNEVTGTSSSLLNGPTEVFGAKADVIVANPNGVTCRSCAFLNTGRVTLSTGVPVPDYTTGTVGFTVRRGTVSIEGTGASAPDGALSRIDLVGRQLAIDGAVTASERVRLRAGAVHWDQQSDIATPLAGVDIPAVSGPAIRSSAAGTVSAGTISVLSRDLDLGVHLTGTLTAGAGDLVVRSLGDLSLAGAAAAGDLDLRAEGALSLAGDHAAAGRLTARGRDVTVAAGARLAANEHIVAEAIRSLDSRGTLAAGGAISLRSSGTLFAAGTASALGNVAIEADDVTTDGFVAAGRHISVSGLGRIRLDATGLAAETDVTVAAPDITLGQGTAFSAHGRVALAARETLTNATVLDYPDLALTVGKRFENRATGALVQDHLALTASEAIVNAGTLYGRLTATLTSDVLTNEAGGVVYGPELTLAVAGELANLGRILSQRTLAVTAAGIANADGIISTDGTLTLRARSYAAGSAASVMAAAAADLVVAGAFDNSGEVIGRDRLALAAGRLANAGRIVADTGALTIAGDGLNTGTIAAVDDLALTLAGRFDSPGHIIAERGALMLSAGGGVTTGGDVIAGTALDVTAAAFESTNAATRVGGATAAFRLTSDLVNRGALIGTDGLTVTARAVTNAAGARAFGKTIALVAGGDLTNDGTIEALDTLSLSTVGALASAGAVRANGAGTLAAGGAFTNTGDVRFGGAARVAAASYLGGAGAVLAADSLAMTLAGAADNAGTIQGAAALDLSAASLSNAGLIAGGRSRLTVAGDGLNPGTIAAVDDLALTLASRLDSPGHIIAERGALMLSAGGGVTTGGDVIAGTALDVTAAGFESTNAATRVGGSSAAFQLTGDFVNRGVLVGTDGLTVAARAVTNAAGARAFGKTLALVAGGDLTNGGTLEALDSLSLSAAGLLANAGAMRANGAGTLTAGGAFINTGEARFGGAAAVTAAGYSGGAGAVLTADALALALTGTADNAGTIQAAGDLQLTAAALTNRATGSITALITDLTVGGDIVNVGAIAARGFLGAGVGGSLTNRGRFDVGGALALDIGGTLANSGMLKAGGDLVVSAASLANTSGAHIEGAGVTLALAGTLVNAGIVDAAGALQLQAAGLDNSGTAGSLAVLSGKTLTALVAGHLANRAHSVLQGRDSAAVQASTTDLDLTRAGGADRGSFNFGKDLALTLTGQGLTIGAGEQLIVDGSLALAVAGNLTVLGTIASRSFLGLASTGGSILVGRNDPGNPGGGVLFTRGDADIRAAGDLRNHASVIEALGDMAITVGGTVLNTRTDVGISNHDFVIPGGTDAYVNQKTQYETSGAATIQADGRLAISAGAVRNLASSIIAGTDLVITAGTVENLARTLTMTETAIRKGVFYGPYVYAVGETPALFHAGGAFSAHASGSFTNTGTVRSQTAEIKAPAITIGITDRNLPTAAPRLPDATIDLKSYLAIGVAALGGIASIPGTGGVVVNGAAALSGSAGLTLPASKPITLPGSRPDTSITFLNGAPIPGGTDERSPGWILDQVGDVRGPITVFADPTTERRLIQQALIEQTGRAVLDPSYRNPIDQQEALYQGTVDFLKANPDIRLGQALTKEQKARIAEPILWYEEKLIDGRPVLVPQLLLPEDRLGEWVKDAGGQLIAGDILLEGDRVHNTGAILAENTLTITAGEFLNEQRAAWTAQGRYAWQELQSGGLIVADSLLVTTERDLVNRGGVLIGNDSLALKAGGDVVLEAQQIANSLFEGNKKRWTRIDTVEHAAGLVASGGDLTIAAGGNLVVAGSTVTAAEDATLAAGGEIVISSVVDVTDIAAGGKKGNVLRRSSFGYSEHEERNVASLVSAGGNLTVAAAGDVTVAASHLAAGEDLTVAAGAGADGREDASVRLLAGQDVRDTAYWKKTSGVGLHFGDGWMDVYRSKKVAATTAEVANVASSLTAGGNVDISAKGDIDIVGSAIAAVEEARLAAGRDVTIAPGMEAEGSTYSRKVSGVGIGVSAGNGSASLSIGAHRDSLYQAHEKTVAEASLIQGGSGVAITAGRDVTAIAADIVSGGDIAVTAGRDLALLAATEVERELEIRKQSFVGLKAEVSQNVSGALEQLKGAASTFNSGHGNDAYKAIGMASGIMQGVDAALQLSNPTLSGSITAGASSSTSRQWAYGETARPTTLTAAGDLTLTAGRDMHLEGTQAVAGQDLVLDVGRDLLVESAQSGYGSFQSSSSKSFGVGVGASVSLTSGATVGLTANGSIAHARDQMSGLQNLNARLDAGETLIIVTGRDATLAGANATGRDVFLNIGSDLTLASRQDTGHGASRSSNIGGSVFVGVGTSPVSGSISVGAGRGSSDHAWVSDQTAIIAREMLDARVEGHTQIDGAVIASLTGDLVLDTGTLGFSDIHDHDKGSSWSAQAGISASTGEKGKAGYTPTGAPTGASLSGHVAEYDREQETRATVGAGEIIIRDTENQTQDVAALNRDLDKAQEITKDERSGVEFYVSSSAAQQVINAANVGMAALYDILMRRVESADDDDLVTGSIASQLESLGGGKPRQVTTPKGATQFIFPNGLIIRFDLLPGQYLSGQVPHINLEVPGIGNHHINLK